MLIQILEILEGFRIPGFWNRLPHCLPEVVLGSGFYIFPTSVFPRKNPRSIPWVRFSLIWIQNCQSIDPCLRLDLAWVFWRRRSRRRRAAPRKVAWKLILWKAPFPRSAPLAGSHPLLINLNNYKKHWLDLKKQIFSDKLSLIIEGWG